MRKFLTMSQFLCHHDMQTHNNSISNLCRGIGERVLFVDKACNVPVAPLAGIFNKRCSSYLRPIVQRLGFQSPVSRQTFVEYYQGPRRSFYQKAVDGLAIKAVHPRDAHLKTFIKAEKLNFSLKPDPAPRVIQPRDPRYNVEVGKYLRPLEHKIYDEIDNIFQSPTIFSKYNCVDQAIELKKKWDKFKKPVCIGLDASRFDQHVSYQALEFEHTLYNMIFKSKELSRLLSWQLHNHGVARANDGWFRYYKKGSRMSGDMNTSMGNKILMCLMAKAYLDTLAFKVEFVNNGDDCLMIFESQHLKKIGGLNTYFRDFGFKIVQEKPVFEFEHIEFCQTKPCYTSSGWRMVRNVKTCMSKDVTCVNLGHNINEFRIWLGKVGDCGSTAAAGVPILQSFYHMLQRFGLDGTLSDGVKFSSEYNWHNKMVKGLGGLSTQITDRARYSFWLQTDISPDLQIELENYFNNSVWGGDKRQFIDIKINL